MFPTNPLRSFLPELRPSKTTIILLIITTASIAVAVYFARKPEKVVTHQVVEQRFTNVPEIRTVTEVKRIYIPCPEKGIQVLDKKEVQKKLNINLAEILQSHESHESHTSQPSELIDQVTTKETPDPTAPEGNYEVTATGDLDSSENGTEVISVLDTTTGETSIIAREKASPWIQIENDLVLGLRYGLNTSAEQAGAAYLGLEFLRIKDLHFLGYAEASTSFPHWTDRGTRPEGKIQLDIQYRRKR